MSGIVKSPLKYSVAEGIYNDILSRNSRYYYFLGKSDAWLGDNDIPEPPSDMPKYEMDVRNNILLMKQIKPSDVSFVIPKYVWTQNTIYDMYDDSYGTGSTSSTGATSLSDAMFYVVNSTDNVYKCIYNNNGKPSTIEPNGRYTDNIVCSDGYVWKFMYYIPVSMQNKFYTSSYMPVMTSLRDGFYENGKIGRVAVDNPGSGYTSSVSLIAQGDGYLENNPYNLNQDVFMSYPGYGYATIPSATITAPQNGQPIGSGSNSKIQATVQSITKDGTGSLTAMTLAQHLNSENATVYGYGYDKTATVTIGPPVVHTKVWEPGLAVTISDIIRVDYLDRPSNFYQIDTAIGDGIMNEVKPIDDTPGLAISYGLNVIAIFVAAQAAVELSMVKTEASFSPILTPDVIDTTSKPILTISWDADIVTVGCTNHGYSINNSVTISGVSPGGYNGIYTILSTGTNFFTYSKIVDPGTVVTLGNCIVPVVSTYSITGVDVLDGGIGYTYCSVLPLDNPDNDSAVFNIDVSIGDINSHQANVEFSAVDGSLSYIVVEHGGEGYAISNTSVTITGDGFGATAVPIIENGVISGITITDIGYGYRKRINVIISGGGIGATARAILAPFGGHGRNAIKELGANTLLFYSALSDERLHLLKNNNDYRQFGLIKNPIKFNSSNRLSLQNASPCYKLEFTSNINTTLFSIDDVLYQYGNDLYNIIVIEKNFMIVQSLTNVTPELALPFINNANGESALADSLIEPQVDKFSGDMIFLDNKAPFLATIDQTISFRTTIGF